MMDSVAYEVIFDVTREGYRFWWFPMAGLVGVLIGAGFFGAASLPQIAARIPGRLIGAGIAILSMIWVIAVFQGSYGDYRRLRRAILSGEYEIVEGTVTNFVPGDTGDHRPETFSVGGRQFSYRAAEVTAGYNRTQPHGGLIREGVRVRIAAVGGEIGRLEIVNSPPLR
jgi:hypothetical protein